MSKNKKVVVYKKIYLNNRSFRIMKIMHNNRLLYTASITTKYRSIGVYKNPREAINAIKEFASIFS